jgi:pilus assembly protein CpaF
MQVRGITLPKVWLTHKPTREGFHPMSESNNVLIPSVTSTNPNSSGDFGTSQGESLTNDHKTVVVTGYAQFKQQIHTKLVDSLNFEEVEKLSEHKRRSEIRTLLQQLVAVEKVSLSGPIDHERLIQELLNDVLGLGPLEDLLRDPTISDILVNGAHEVYVERKGKLYSTEVHFKDDNHLLQVIDRIVSRIGRRVDETSPMVDARLKDGSRVNVILPPLSLRGPTMSIRRFGTSPLLMKDLLAFKALTPEMALLVESAVKARLNMIICGGTGSGKTTLLNALSSVIPRDERVVTIEDAAELQMQQPHVVQLESRQANIEGKGQVTIRDLLRNALRMRPDRIVIGECRGGEALDMLQAMNTGHEGSLTTLHANTPRDGLSRLETMIMMSGFDMPVKAMRQQICSALDLIIQTNRLQGGGRRVTSITEVMGMEGDMIVIQDIFQFRQTGVSANGEALGVFEALGIRPSFMPRLKSAGIDFPPNMFETRVLLSV